MEAAKADAPDPEQHEGECPTPQPGPSKPGLTEVTFSGPVEDPQGCLGIFSDKGFHGGSHNETDMVEPSHQSKIGPFISRPELEDPVNFEVDFKYMKAPTHQSLPFHSLVPPNGVGMQSGSAISIPGQTVRSSHHLNPTLRTIKGLDDQRDVRLPEASGGETVPEIGREICDAVSIPSDPLSNVTTPENRQTQKREFGTSPNGELSGPPFQGSPLFNKLSSPFRSRYDARNPVFKLDKSKLSKAFSDIQRKAIIQSTRVHSGDPEYLSRSRVDKTSPGQLNDTNEIRHIGEKRDQAHLGGHHVRNQRLHTPEAQSLVHKSHASQSKITDPTRPFAQDRQQYSVRKRPESQASNISMPRAPRGRGRSHVRRRTSPTLEESYALRNGLNQCWNRFFSFEETRNKHWEEKIEDLVEQLVERDAKLAEYLAELGMKDRMIVDLKAEKEKQLTLYKEQEYALTEAKRHHQKLQGKMKEYKDRLNDATNEQQTIFKYFQPRYHQLRDQLKTEERNHQLALEQAIASADGVRDKIQKSVAEVRTLSQRELHTMKLEIETLRVKLAERENELDREREHINDLRRELNESHEHNRDVIKSLNIQNQELLEKSNERSAHVQNIAQCINQQEQKIESVLKLMEENKTIAPSNTELVEDLKILHVETLNSIMSALGEHAASGRELSSKTTEEFKADISAIRESCASLSTQIQESQNASEWQQKFGRVQLDHQVLLREADRLKQKLTEMREEAKIQLQKHESLQEELITLKATEKSINESDKRAENLEKAKQQLQKSLDEREARIRDLEENVRGTNEALHDQNRSLRDQERLLHEEREKRTQEVDACHQHQEEVIKQVKKEEYSRVLAEYGDIEQRLQDMEQDRSRLQKELEQAKRETDAAQKNLEGREKQMEVLESAAKLIDKFSNDLQGSGQAQRDLNAKLEAWSNDQAVASLIQQAVQKLTVDQRAAIENGKQLGELLDVQKKLDDTWQRHKSQFDAPEWAAEFKKTDNVKKETDGDPGHNIEQFPEMPQDVNRRVTIQSPVANDIYDEIVPISIEDERAIRRQACVPKGIIKSGVSKAWERQEEHYHSTLTAAIKQTEAKPTLVSRSAYNRPVLGTAEGVDDEASNFIAGGAAIRSSEVSSIIKKRKRAETQANQGEDLGKWEKPQHTERRRAKLSRSMSEYFHDPAHEEPAVEPMHPRPTRGGPIERKPRSFVTYGSSN